MMEVFVGTSGWLYSWNQERSLDWYVSKSGLNAIELNMSFYRFPFPSMVESWFRKGKSLRWSIKVNRLITHNFKFNEAALSSWRKFQRLFLPLEPYVDFYLFQLPPFMKTGWAQKIEDFTMKTGLGRRFALEIRNAEWLGQEWVDWASRLGITLVSIDSPEFPLDIFNTRGSAYVRMHGRSAWYSHLYTEEELGGVVRKILNAQPNEVYVFFNNDHGMLPNSQRILSMLRDPSNLLWSKESRGQNRILHLHHI